MTDRNDNKVLESSLPLAATVRELVRHKVSSMVLYLYFYAHKPKISKIHGIWRHNDIFQEVKLVNNPLAVNDDSWTYLGQFRLQGMKHFNLEGTLKQLNVTLQLCRAMWSHALLQLFASAIVLPHTKPWARYPMLLQIAAQLWLLTEITSRHFYKLTFILPLQYDIADEMHFFSFSPTIRIEEKVDFVMLFFYLGRYWMLLQAISRRATLYEMIRDYSQAARDLERLVARITKQLEDKTNQIGASDRSNSSTTNDLRQARLRLSEIEEESRKDIPLDMYLIL